MALEKCKSRAIFRSSLCSTLNLKMLDISLALTGQVQYFYCWAFLILLLTKYILVHIMLMVSITLFLIFDKQANYITIDDRQLIIDGFFTRKIYLKEITSFEINGYNLKIFKNRGEINIDISLITEASHTELISFLEKLKPIKLNH